jgi:hypothetical protein
MSYLYVKKDYKKIILNTEDAVANVGKANAGTGNSEFVFNKFNNISIKEPSYLKVDGVSSDTSGDAVFTFKLDKVDYNKASYYNSDLNGLPTILTRCFNGKSSLNLDGVALELTKQDVNEIKLVILDDEGNGVNNAKISIELSVEEIPRDIFNN